MQFSHLGIGMTWSSINLVLDFYNPAVELLWNTLKARGLHMKKSFKKAICDRVNRGKNAPIFKFLLNISEVLGETWK